MPPQVISIEDQLTPNQVAAIAKVTPKTLANWRALGIGPCFIKLSPGRGGRVRYPQEGLQEWLKVRRIETAA